jgi:hypothetical protein
MLSLERRHRMELQLGPPDNGRAETYACPGHVNSPKFPWITIEDKGRAKAQETTVVEMREDRPAVSSNVHNSGICGKKICTLKICSALTPSPEFESFGRIIKIAGLT